MTEFPARGRSAQVRPKVHMGSSSQGAGVAILLLDAQPVSIISVVEYRSPSLIAINRDSRTRYFLGEGKLPRNVL